MTKHPKYLSSIEIALFRLAKLSGIKPDRGWKKALAERFDLKPNVFSAWIRRDQCSTRGLLKIRDAGFPLEDWLIVSKAYEDKEHEESLKQEAEHLAKLYAPDKEILPDIGTAQKAEGIQAYPPHDVEAQTRTLEKEGLHARTQQMEVGGQEFTLSLFSPGRDWVHKAVDEILDSDDTSTIAALESNVHVFVEKVRKEKRLEDRLSQVEDELKRVISSHQNLRTLTAARQQDLHGLKVALERTIKTAPIDKKEQKAQTEALVHQIDKLIGKIHENGQS